jgi:tetratricopeptide (TPR) repeat protein
VTALPPARRFAVAIAAVAFATVLFKAQVASALVTRGDDLLRAGDIPGAVRCYGRATRLDAASPVAADRLAFYLLVRRGAGDAAAAYGVADRTLHALPHDPALLADRALAAQRLGRWRDAERDFATAASAARDPRYAHLAARMAERSRDRGAVRAHLLAALALDPAYAPARRALNGKAR